MRGAPVRMVTKKSKQARRKQRAVKAVPSPYGLISEKTKPEALAIANSVFAKLEHNFRNQHKGIMDMPHLMRAAVKASKEANALYADFQKSITVVEEFKSFNEVGSIGMSVNFGPKGNEGYTASECIKRRQNTVAFLRNIRINSPRMWKDLLAMIDEAKK